MKKFRFFPAGLWRTGLRHLLQNRWFSVLMIIGIAIGVAVVIAIDIANASALRSFELSKQVVTGSSTHQIVGGPEGLDDDLYVQLRRQGIVGKASPVIETIVTSPQLDDRPFSLLGVDVFADREFRSYYGAGDETPVDQLLDFLTIPGAVLVSTETADRYALEIGDPLEISIGGRRRQAQIAGLIKPSDPLSGMALEGVLLADIATVQEMTDQSGRLDRIDLIIPEDSPESVLDDIRALLPEGSQVVSTESRSSAVGEMTRAFQTNLTALSLLALLVGLFMIYNTITYSVIRRRSLFGLLRCIGVTRGEIVTMVVSEALLVGLAGTALGLLAGVLLGRQTIAMVTQTFNDLYYTTTVQSVLVPTSSFIKGGILGVAATVFTALFPALEASFIPPSIAMSRSGLEAKARNLVVWLGLAGVGVLLTGLLVFAIPSRSIVLGFIGTLLVVLGLAMESAVLLTWIVRIIRPISGALAGFLGRMAPASLVNNLSRTAVAVSALMVAVAVAVGMNLMISSFRSTVSEWLEQTLEGDIYVSAPSFISTQSNESIDPRIIAALKNDWPQIDRVDTLRTVSVESSLGPVTLNATENPDFGTERLYLHLEVDSSSVWEEMNKGGILVSEALAYRLDLPRSGGVVTLLTRSGWQDFPVIGVIYEYTSSEGSVWMAYDIYQNFWQDDGITALALRLSDPASADQTTRSLQDAYADVQSLVIRPNRVLRAEVLRVFDRTFAITNAMRLMATVVAFIGVLTTALLLQLEKRRELGILRALGLTGRQVWALVLMESGLIGLVAGLLALPTGVILSMILVEVINRRSFGWTILLEIPVGALAQGLLIATAAALLAGIYPAWRLNRMVTAEAIRYE